jgi:hypothetical protein
MECSRTALLYLPGNVNLETTLENIVAVTNPEFLEGSFE